MRKIKKWIPALLGAVLLVNGTVQAKEQEKYERQIIYFDTVITLSFYAGDNGNELMDHCIQMCDDFENTFSRTKEDSELYKINHRTENEVIVSDEMIELVAVGLEYYEKSNGKFDITIAPLSDLWDFKSEDAKVPPEKEIEEALKKVDGGSVHIKDNKLIFDNNDTMIDLGALVKGYAADELKDYLVGEGVESGLLNLGGNVLTIGSKPDGSSWNIGVQTPFSTRNSISVVVPVIDQTVVSSGIYERFFEQDGKIYHHILDPDTGYSVENAIEGISIICDSSLQGDALSTTCLLVGPDKAKEIVEKEGVRAVVLEENEEPIYLGEGWD